ncbi:hypothetical protein CHARACLAT_012039 [Characodon lateralis]|uniref:Uncharacterized protein n=1 Tax=Characodon lateralis TaxID=208331 RepID=A0ABU7DZW6_9TELE|nr:hypothetical protein [Characodon lateralis]
MDALFFPAALDEGKRAQVFGSAYLCVDQLTCGATAEHHAGAFGEHEEAEKGVHATFSPHTSSSMPLVLK